MPSYRNTPAFGPTAIDLPPGVSPRRANAEGIKNNVELRIIEIGRICHGRCASCGAFNNDPSSEISDSDEQITNPHHLSREEIRHNLEQTIGEIREGVTVRVHDLLGKIYTTGIKAEPLESRSFEYLAEEVFRLTNGRSKGICISHGEKSIFNKETGRWESVTEMSRNMEKIANLMIQGKVSNFVLSVDTSRDAGRLGTENIRKKQNTVFNLLRLQEQKVECLNTLKSLLSEEDNPAVLNSCTQILNELMQILSEENSFTQSSLATRQEEKEALEQILQDASNNQCLSTYANNRLEKINRKLQLGREDIKTRKVEIGKLRKIQNWIYEKSKLNEEDSPLNPGELEENLKPILDGLPNATSRLEELEKEKRSFPAKIDKITIEANAQSYFQTILKLIPVLETTETSPIREEDKRVTLSLQGDLKQDSLVSSAKASAVLTRLKELIVQRFGERGASAIFERVRIEPPRPFVAVGRAKTFLGITDENIHCPLIPDRTLSSMYPVTRSNHGRLYMNGDLAFQLVRADRTYDDLANPHSPISPNPWIPIDLKNKMPAAQNGWKKNHSEVEVDEDDF